MITINRKNFRKAAILVIIAVMFSTNYAFSDNELYCAQNVCVNRTLDQGEKQKADLILSSVCSPNIQSKIDFMWTTPNADNYYHLVNGSLWQDYQFEEGFLVLQNTSSYNRVDLFPNVPVYVYKTPVGFCKMKFNDKEIYVRRIY